MRIGWSLALTCLFYIIPVYRYNVNMQLGLMTMMTVMTMPLGYPLAWGYIKISVIIVMTVIF